MGPDRASFLKYGPGDLSRNVIKCLKKSFPAFVRVSKTWSKAIFWGCIPLLDSWIRPRVMKYFIVQNYRILEF